MNILETIKRLSDAGKYDICASSASSRKPKTNDRVGDAAAGGICHSFTASGQCISLYKTLYTNYCTHDCKYCQNSSCKQGTIASFTPEKLAKTFMNLYMRNYVEGLFLSSGIAREPDAITEKMIESVKLLREKYKFQGYIHFKALPGVSRHLLKQIKEHTDRMSINVEAANASRLNELSSIKVMKTDILRRQRWIKDLKLQSGQTTQMVIGAAGESDLEALKMTRWEYNNMNLKRVYYSAFSPVKGTALEQRKATPLRREHRLYNSDWLLRKYKFKFQDIANILNENDNLPDKDPKLLMAQKSNMKAIDINTASYEELIRVPGIGLQSAHRILSMQKENKKIKKRIELKNMGIVLKRATPYVRIDGHVQKTITAY